MKKAENFEVEVYTNPVQNQTLASALDGLKSFSPGETYEFLQTKFPLYPLKSKAHHKTAEALVAILENLISDGEFQKNEVAQIRLYLNTLKHFIDNYVASLVEETPAPNEAAGNKKGFANQVLTSLKNVADAEKKRFFEFSSKTKSPDEPLEASFRKIRPKK